MRSNRLSALALALALPVLSSCGASQKPQQCAASVATRPSVHLTFVVAYSNMDDDPPRPKVSLLVRSAKDDRVELGQLVGVCKLAELGAIPDVPVSGAALAELRCSHGKRTSVARVVHAGRSEVLVRRFEQGDQPPEDSGWAGGKMPTSDPHEIKNVRDVATLAVPECAKFDAELGSPDKAL